MTSPYQVYTRAFLRQKSFTLISILQPTLRLHRHSTPHNLRTTPLQALSPRFYSYNPVLPASTLPPPPRRSLPRTLAFTSLLLLLATTAFTMAVSPVLPLLTPSPTNAETLSLYQPPSELEASINETLLTHPLTLSLRANPSFTESRPHMKIPPAARANNLTAGLLNRPDGIPVPPLFFSEAGGKSAVILYYLGKNVCGHPGIVHGGLLATILDEGLARCCFPALPNKVGMTASLKVEYKAPVPAESFVVLRAETRRVEGRKAWVVGWVESLPAEGEEVRVFVEAEALFIEPRQAATMSRLYPASAG